jgi:hypothetical protein
VSIRCLLLLVLLASPAMAETARSIPEPGDAALFVIAVVGLIVGRYAAGKAPPRRRHDNDWDT